jgi:Domain of unknown function (DUF4290)
MEKYYNTQQESVLLKEYGRNIQKLVQFVINVPDRDERTRYSYTLVELMRQINPNTRDTQDTQNKLWDDLYIMSQFRLDVDSPFPMPSEDVIYKKPRPLKYSSNRLAFKHYGRNVELMIDRAYKLEDSDEKFSAVIQIAKLMKTFYTTWNRDSIMDNVILDHIEHIAKKPLDEEIRTRIKVEGALDGSMKDNRKQLSNNNNNNKSNQNNNIRNRKNRPKGKK